MLIHLGTFALTIGLELKCDVSEATKLKVFGEVNSRPNSLAIQAYTILIVMLKNHAINFKQNDWFRYVFICDE